MKHNGDVFLHHQVLTLPNLLTGLRLLLLPVFAFLLYQGKFKASLAVFVVSGVSDFFDGLLARRFQARSKLGTYLDPIADHSTVILVFLLLSFFSGLAFRIPVWLFLVIAVRDFLVGGSQLAVLRIQGLKPLEPIFLGKVSAFCQYITAGLVVLANVAPGVFEDHLRWLLVFAYILTGVVTVFSGTQYLVQGYTFLRERRQQ